MSLTDSDRMKLENAISAARYPIPLNGSRLLDADGVCDIIRRLDESQRKQHAIAIHAAAREERAMYERDCLQKDYEKWKAIAQRLEREIASTARLEAEACAAQCEGEQQACLSHARNTKGKAAHNVHMVAAQTAAECARRCRLRHRSAESESTEKEPT